MSENDEWFAPKRYGYGSGFPIRWQGWAVTLAYVAAVLGTALLLRNRPLQVMAVILPLTAVFIVIAARTTRGGWRWRWGQKD
jgi:hypothetical protein